MTQRDKPVSIARTRRSLAKAAGIAFGALLALPSRSQRAEAMGSTRCFLAGTRIRTALGDRRVEDLSVGEFVPTRFGGVQPILAIGHRRLVRGAASAWPVESRPVRVAASALDDGLPHTDLLLSAAHGLLIDGVLIPVGHLVNGTTITIDPAQGLDTLDYFHLELAGHDVVEAHGVACETLRGEGEPCAPIASLDGGRAAAESRLRSALSPWIDRRHPLDVVRDRLEERGLSGSRA